MPDAAYIRAKRREIARRYAWARKQHRKPITMAVLRLRDLGKLLDARYPKGLPDNAIGRDFVTVMAHHLAVGPRNPNQSIPGFVRYYARWMTIAEIDELIANAIAKPMRLKADALAWRLKLTDADRTKLKITTIGSIDVPKRQRLQRRKQRQRDNYRKWRAAQKEHYQVALYTIYALYAVLGVCNPPKLQRSQSLRRPNRLR